MLKQGEIQRPTAFYLTAVNELHNIKMFWALLPRFAAAAAAAESLGRLLDGLGGSPNFLASSSRHETTTHWKENSWWSLDYLVLVAILRRPGVVIGGVTKYWIPWSLIWSIPWLQTSPIQRHICEPGQQTSITELSKCIYMYRRGCGRVPFVSFGTLR